MNSTQNVIYLMTSSVFRSLCLSDPNPFVAYNNHLCIATGIIYRRNIPVYVPILVSACTYVYLACKCLCLSIYECAERACLLVNTCKVARAAYEFIRRSIKPYLFKYVFVTNVTR